jgi:cytosine/adenosine deaminase-related metal-dependent hydrolase
MLKPLRIVGAKIYSVQNREFPFVYTDQPFDDQFKLEQLYLTDTVVAEPHPHALTLDLTGYAVFPGLINAHDHLELNHYPRSKFRERYDNAHQWGEDVNARLNEPPFKQLRAYPLADRLLIGGLKNILSGVTTVIHHNPPYKPLFRKSFPVRVIKNYGWAHSLHFDTPQHIKNATARTPFNDSFFIHLAEGTDDIAAREYQTFKSLVRSSKGSNLFLIHCVGMTDDDLHDIGWQGDGWVTGVIWCPTTNLYLLGRTIDYEKVDITYNVNALGIGSDSRLTADGDFLDEIRAAYTYMKTYPNVNHEYKFHFIVNLGNAFIFINENKSLYGYLNLGAPADWIAYPQSKKIYELRRADLALVVRGGIPQIGDPDLMLKFPHVTSIEATLDGVPKRIHIDLARQIARCSLHEPGLQLLQSPFKNRFF